jgi:hypothetical protein
MRKPRYSIASGLAIIGILGVALAAFRDPSYLWANVTFSAALAALVLAIINAVYSRGARRAYWLGFALCGWAYFAITSVPGLRQSLCPRLVTEVIFDLLYLNVAPQAPVAPPAPEIGWSAWSQPDRTNGVGYPIGTVSLVSSEAFRQIGHSMAALLVAVLGGIYARGRYAVWAMTDGAGAPHEALA